MGGVTLGRLRSADIVTQCQVCWERLYSAYLQGRYAEERQWQGQLRLIHENELDDSPKKGILST